MKPQEPWSTATGLAYLPAAFVAYEMTGGPEAALLAVALCLLGGFTAWRHWAPSSRSSKADQTSMHFALGSMVFVGLGLPWLAAGLLAATIGVAVEWRFDFPLRPVIGAWMAPLLIVAGVLSVWWVPFVAAVPMGGGLYLRDRYEDTEDHDLFHGVAWHLGALAGLIILLFAIV